MDDIDDIQEISGLSFSAGREPMQELLEREQNLAKHADALEGRVDECFARAAKEDEEDSLPASLEAMSDWRRAKDAQVGSVLDDIIAVAELDKAEGNRLFQAGQCQGAYAAYKKSLDAFEEFSPAMLTGEARKLNVALYCNAAQALLRCVDVAGASTDGARAMAEKALSLEPTNVKALFRRGCAHANAEDWNLARNDLQKVLHLDPDNEAAKRELHRIKDKRTVERPAPAGVPTAAEAAAPAAPKRGRGAFSSSLATQAATAPTPSVPGEEAGSSREPTDAEKIDAMRKDRGKVDPAEIVKSVQEEARRLRKALLKKATENKKSLGCSARLDAAESTASEWAKHQLSDPETVRDIVLFQGAIFGAMTLRQKKDFLAATDFLADMRKTYAKEVAEIDAKTR